MTDLAALNQYRPTPSSASGLPDTLTKVITPLIFPAWDAALRDHPDPEFRQFIVSGLTNGFRLGFNRSQQLVAAPSNMPSARLHHQVIDDPCNSTLRNSRNGSRNSQSISASRIRIRIYHEIAISSQSLRPHLREDSRLCFFPSIHKASARNRAP